MSRLVIASCFGLALQAAGFRSPPKAANDIPGNGTGLLLDEHGQPLVPSLRDAEPGWLPKWHNEMEIAQLARVVYMNNWRGYFSVIPRCWEKKVDHNFDDRQFGGKDRAQIYECRCDHCRSSDYDVRATSLGRSEASGGLHAGLDEGYNTNPTDVTGTYRMLGNRTGEAEVGAAEVRAAAAAKPCVLAFAGTDELKDWFANWGIGLEPPAEFCGLDIWYPGWVNQLTNMLTDPKWTSEFLPFLQSCDRLLVTGHSLGAAIATLFAYCANMDDTTVGKPDSLKGITPEVELMTLGSPGVATEAIRNGRAPGTGIFRGIRFFHFSASWCLSQTCSPLCCFPPSVDYASTFPWGYRHPYHDVIGLDHYGLGLFYGPGDKTWATLTPKSFVASLEFKKWLHEPDEYIVSFQRRALFRRPGSR